MNDKNSGKDGKELIVHFAHANGFPAQSYAKLFSQLSSNIELIALDKFAHSSEFPLNNNWENQADELIHFVEKEQISIGGNLPIVLVGHSFGAVVSYLACCKKPSLFSGLILLDPPLLTGLASWVFRFAKKGKLIDKLTPAGKTKIRNTKWHHKTDLIQYFKARALFKNMDIDCISDYVSAVMHEYQGQRQLNFDVEVEANIFRTIPVNLHKQYGKLQAPCYLLTGKNTDVCRPKQIKHFLKGNPTITHQSLDFGGHMFPLEKPIELAAQLNDIISAFTTTRPNKSNIV
ncbi:MAG: pimeloyl-ACP methyl ester carboxylesterase [Glaciecola sp.]|jgi:pimeloyl-ACP methyl ester carboxylesterase